MGVWLASKGDALANNDFVCVHWLLTIIFIKLKVLLHWKFARLGAFHNLSHPWPTAEMLGCATNS